MQISEIIINNFRSIKYAKLAPTAFNIFVGQNNHGKTNIFEAIEWFYNGSGNAQQIVHMQDSNSDFSVEIEFTGIQNGIETVKNESIKESFRKFAGTNDVIRVIRRKSDTKRLLWNEEKKEWNAKNFAGFDKAFNDCLPRLEYVSTVTKLGDVSKWGKKTPIGLMLSGVLAAVLDKSEKYQQFRKKFEEVFEASDSDIRVSLDEISGKVKVHLEQQFPDCTKVAFDVSAPAFDDLLKNFETSINDGIETTAEEKGDGMQRALMLAIIKTYSDYRKEKDELGKRFVFLIDEAELHLHPTAQRQLKEALLVLAKNGDQIFINTHSSVLVADDEDTQSIYSVVKSDCKTEITKATTQDKHQIVYDLLGGNPSDLLLPNNFLIVEGRTEYEFLTGIIKKFYSDKPYIQIIFSSGDIVQQERSMYAINVAFTPLYKTPVYKDRLVILCDKPNENQRNDYDKFVKAYPIILENGQLITLPCNSIEEYYPDKWKKTQEEAKKMKKDGEKTSLVKKVVEEITQELFESNMPVVYEALKKSWENAY